MAMTKQKDAPELIDAPPGIAPWKSHPHLYRSREHFAEVVLDASEASSFFEGIPLAKDEELVAAKEQILAELRRLYPDHDK